MYVLQACDAIAEAHAAGIIHRDLKPANLFLIRRPNGSFCVKVLDFGISKHTGPEDVELTETGMMLGSPRYMSPEQIARTKQVDARSDIWSLGVVLYELVTGRVPFPGQTTAEVVARVIQEEPAAPSEVRPGIPPAIDAVMARCLRKLPGDRFQSVGELMQALQGLLSPEWPAGASPAGLAGVYASARASSPGWPAGASPAGLAGVYASARASMPSSPAGYATPGAPPGPASTDRGGSPDGSTASSAPTLVQLTGAAWEHTAPGSRPSSGAKLAVALCAVAALPVVGAGIWIGFGRSKNVSPSLEAIPAAPAATEPSAPPPSGSASPAESASPAMATAAAVATGAASEASAAAEPSTPGRPPPARKTARAGRPQLTSWGEVAGGSAAGAATSAVPASPPPIAPIPQTPPTPTAAPGAPAKKKRVGIY